MKTFKWNSEKERMLINDGARGGVGFADCVVAVDEGRVLDVLPHPKLGHQRLLIVNIEDYAFVAPFVVEEDGSWFLKTVFPSRKFTEIYLERKEP